MPHIVEKPLVLPPPFRERRAVPNAGQVRIAHVVAVSGSHAVALLERGAESSSRDNDPRVQIGAIVKIVTPNAAVVGQVTTISAPMPEFDGKKEEIGIIEISLAGEISADDQGEKATFRRGVPSPPSLGDPVFLADRQDLTCLYAPQGVATIKVGSVLQDPAVPARLLTDEMLAKHFIVVGSTGSGKSCALTCILRRLLDVHKAARVVILDVHNEYSNAFGDLVEHINLENFCLPLWMLNFKELAVALTSREDSRDEEIEILGEAVLHAKRRFFDTVGRTGALVRKYGEGSTISVDTPSPFRVSDVIGFIEDELGRLERKRVMLAYRRLKARIETLVADRRHNFLFGSLTVQDNMTNVLGRLFRIPIDGRPISIIDLSAVPHEILDVVVSVITRLAFDLAVWSEGDVPMLIVAEEAHRYAPAMSSNDKFQPTREALGRIAKEGRKYGLSLALVTQRPSELDATILSQCSTAIAMRLMSERDQQVLRDGPYRGMLDLFDFLPLLGDREAIILGQGVTLPMRIKFDDLGEGGVPKNMNRGFSQSWEAQNIDHAKLDAIVARWRLTGREAG